MEIRLVTLDDIAAICRLYEEFFAHNSGLQPSYYRAAAETGGYPKSTMEDNAADIFVAVENRELVGFLHIRESKTPPFDAFVPHRYAEVIDFITTAAHRGKGIGTMLMDAAKQWAKARNLDYIELFVLSEATEETRFYQHKGFVPVSQTMRCTL